MKTIIMKKKLLAHMLAFFSVIVWGSTFISTKILLMSLGPYQILLYRCFIAWIILWICHFKRASAISLKNEAFYLLASLFGVTLYFICENTALTYTYSSNASLIVTTAPLLSIIFSSIFTSEKNFSKYKMTGALMSMAGVTLVITNGIFNIRLHPQGDFLALLAAIFWALFPILLNIIKDDNDIIVRTRKIFFYSIFSIVIFMLLTQHKFYNSNVITPLNITNILFLGIIASALCYIFWGYSVTIINASSTMMYMYLVPISTLILGKFILDEKITLLMFIGACFIIIGVYIGNNKQQNNTHKIKDYCK